MSAEIDRLLGDASGEALRQLQQRIKRGEPWAIKLAATLGVGRFPHIAPVPGVAVQSADDLGPAALAVANTALACTINWDVAKAAMEALTGAAGGTKLADLEAAIADLRERQGRAENANKPGRGGGPAAVIMGRF